MECLVCKGDGVVVETCECCGAEEDVSMCDRCDGEGVEERYIVPLKTTKAYLQTHKQPRGEFLKLACIGGFNPDYTQMGRNFAAFLVRNAPKAYVLAVYEKLNSMAMNDKL